MADLEIIVWSEKLLQHLLKRREKNPDLRFWLRQRDKKGRLSKGQWFQGDDDRYISIGWYDRKSGNLSTRSVSFMVGPNGDGTFWKTVEILFKAESDQKIIDFYLEAILRIGRFRKENEFKYVMPFSHDNVIECLDEFLDDIKPIFDQVKEEMDLSSVLDIKETNFQEWLLKINQIRSQKSESIEGINKNKSPIDMKSLNQILYGPPGTGKTYHTINRTLSIIEGKSEEELKKEDRSEIKRRFDDLIKSGQIVFTTFHQSMSYEDFIEGLKPKSDEGQINYEIEDGIFKETVNHAKYEYYKSVFKDARDLSRDDFFNLAFDEYLDILRSDIQGGKTYELNTKSGEQLVIDKITDRDVIYLKHQNSKRPDGYPVSKKRLERLFKHFVDIDSIKNIDKEFRAVIGGSNVTAYWAVLNEVNKIYERTRKKGAEQYLKELKDYGEIKKVIEHFVISNDQVNGNGIKPYLLIIDEINRGNVSQIFGELITLIEEDKRAGKPEALSVTLPYSKEKFSVPPNLYIIGTMNTADRSVEALDVALRRRFVFEYMPSKPELLSPHRIIWELYWKYKDADWKSAPFEPIEQSYYEMLKGLTKPDGENHNSDAIARLDLEKSTIWKNWANEKDESQIEQLANFGLIGLDNLLEVINERIAYLKDEDHQIGHSYFMNVYSKEDLARTFSKNILPLLKEYFYNDFGKIRLVLGDGFVKRKDNWKPDFASDDEVLEGTTYELVPIDEGMILDALRITLGHKKGT